mmetsp:Transcript_28141/g.84153  ORF Transcript_28141/g.84153 Transcript_28141/m.84153 type:complete len:903 (-) Transcript_28141:179-2887(-)
MAAPANPPAVHKGWVKSVLSGDTIVIWGRPRGGPPPEKVISLAGIVTPRLGRRPAAGQEADESEPFAWEAREFLREKLVGEEVSFTIDYTVQGGREYGKVFLGSGATAENVTMSLVQAGLASIYEGRGSEDDAASQALSALEAHAKVVGVGVHADAAIKANAVRKMKWTLDDPAALVKKLDFKPTKVVIEHVRDAANFRVTILPLMQSVSVSLTGIRGASFRRNEGGKEVAEPHASEGKYWTESRLLQRKVDMIFEGTTASGLLGTVLHPRGNISVMLLAEGFAKIMDSSFVEVTGDKSQMRAAEAAAKESGIRIWSGYKKMEINIPQSERVFTGTVEEIISVERLKVRKDSGEVVEISLSSIRQPRRPRKRDDAKGGADGGAAEEGDGGAPKRRPKPLFDVPYMFEARELLRKKLVGKRADVSIDYVRPAEDRFPERVCATVTASGTNVAEALVSKGLASVLRHDDFRAAAYDNLMSLERHAQKNKVGMHKGSGGQLRVADINGKAMASTFLSSMQRGGRVSGIVEHVVSGSRLRVFVPKESCSGLMILAGVSCPRTSYQDKPGEPFAEEALAFSRAMCLQKDVQLEVSDTDARGNFVGQVFVDGRNLSVELLQRGLAEMHPSAGRYGVEAEFKGSQDIAMNAKVGVWEGYDPAAPVAAAAADGENGAGAEGHGRGSEEVTVTEVVDAITFYAQATSAASTLSELSTNLNTVLSKEQTKLDVPKRGLLCACKFTEDDLWYRARINNVDKETGKIEVRYADYGNSEEVDASRLATLPEEFTELSDQARRMGLTLLAPPPADYADEAKGVLAKGILNMTYNCEVLGKDSFDGVTTELVRLVHAESEDDVAMTMLSLGYAMVGRSRDRNLNKMRDILKKCETEAKAAHEGMWMYGDISEDPREI